MPHPSIHKTLEAKMQASREKNRCHYAKERILSRRRELHIEKDTGPSELQKAAERFLHRYDSDEEEDENELEMSDDSGNVEENDSDDNIIPSDLPGCLLAIKRIKDDMLSLINEPRAFTEALLLQFVKSITYTDDR
ncbi:uncharacterized protein F5891DRAFT_1186575 [Suillus fuscotomentosus]|uniref:Uncharacterized protein n=1 Tax=Suillus fuscotomentosus TaxID=1912939 RepID=A0AAD4EAP6_9AGAM|nr:uncharacterized protein F5891DRAFT_1186575 [Suillus fuscotomentosus]KAG1902461.1 hypothetical protein F5891DRAFT_1186575 [Suillus fuscotomentosus]